MWREGGREGKIERERERERKESDGGMKEGAHTVMT